MRAWICSNKILGQANYFKFFFLFKFSFWFQHTRSCRVNERNQKNDTNFHYECKIIVKILLQALRLRLVCMPSQTKLVFFFSIKFHIGNAKEVLKRVHSHCTSNFGYFNLLVRCDNNIRAHSVCVMRIALSDCFVKQKTTTSAASHK